VVSWNGNIGQDITIHSPASLLIELKVDWDKDMTRAVHQVQGNGSDNKKVSKELLLFLREQADDAGGLAVGGMLPAGHQQASSAAGGSGSKGRVRLAAWPVTATKAVEKLLVVEKPLAKMNAQELANHGVLSLEWDVDLDQDGYPKQVLANANQLQSLLDFINQVTPYGWFACGTHPCRTMWHVSGLMCKAGPPSLPHLSTAAHAM
jgi:hypothetical protein